VDDDGLGTKGLDEVGDLVRGDEVAGEELRGKQQESKASALARSKAEALDSRRLGSMIC